MKTQKVKWTSAYKAAIKNEIYSKPEWIPLKGTKDRYDGILEKE